MEGKLYQIIEIKLSKLKGFRKSLANTNGVKRFELIEEYNKCKWQINLLEEILEEYRR